MASIACGYPIGDLGQSRGEHLSQERLVAAGQFVSILVVLVGQLRLKPLDQFGGTDVLAARAEHAHHEQADEDERDRQEHHRVTDPQGLEGPGQHTVLWWSLGWRLSLGGFWLRREGICFTFLGPERGSRNQPCGTRQYTTQKQHPKTGEAHGHRGPSQQRTPHSDLRGNKAPQGRIVMAEGSGERSRHPEPLDEATRRGIGPLFSDRPPCRAICPHRAVRTRREVRPLLLRYSSPREKVW
jgi:hypothetical protein